MYCDKKSKEAHELMYHEFFSAVKTLTGKPVCFHFIHGVGLRVWLMDLDVAQAPGLGSELVLTKQACKDCPVETDDPDELLEHVLKLCITHYKRYATLLLM